MPNVLTFVAIHVTSHFIRKILLILVILYLDYHKLQNKMLYGISFLLHFLPRHVMRMHVRVIQTCLAHLRDMTMLMAFATLISPLLDKRLGLATSAAHGLLSLFPILCSRPDMLSRITDVRQVIHFTVTLW